MLVKIGFIGCLCLSAFVGATELEIQGCQLFIEKAGVSYQDQNIPSVNLFLRASESLDSPIQSVVFYSHQHYVDSGVPMDRSAQLPAVRYGSARDLWVISIAVDARKGADAVTETGSFEVTTEKGTQYWLRGKDDGDFNLGPSLFTTVSSLVSQSLNVQSVSSSNAPPIAPEVAVFTQQALPDLNPNLCR
jgi:hypothetical protein